MANPRSDDIPDPVHGSLRVRLAGRRACRRMADPSGWIYGRDGAKRRCHATRLNGILPCRTRRQTPPRCVEVSLSVGLDIGGPDHFAPLFGLVGDELAEVG